MSQSPSPDLNSDSILSLTVSHHPSESQESRLETGIKKQMARTSKNKKHNNPIISSTDCDPTSGVPSQEQDDKEIPVPETQSCLTLEPAATQSCLEPAVQKTNKQPNGSDASDVAEKKHKSTSDVWEHFGKSGIGKVFFSSLHLTLQVC
ncbi:hypothetical protein MJO29_013006 [Puccinia striiformis f. sp. tritici]|nr:hypothetical protein MJO29_013006 [Puccinia striiformis f. sp. tritici]